MIGLDDISAGRALTDTSGVRHPCRVREDHRPGERALGIVCHMLGSNDGRMYYNRQSWRETMTLALRLAKL